jgi:glycosyltransferase involved in cell wall biosynthesis
MTLYFASDPLENLYGPSRPPFLLAGALRRHHDVVFVSPKVSNEVEGILRSEGFEVLSMNRHFLSQGSLLTLEAWLRRCNFPIRHKNSIVVNFSQCFLTDAYIYYAQGPITRALGDMYPEMGRTYRVAYRFARPFFVRRDKDFVKRLRERSRFFIANSRFCASMYEDLGIKVDDIIYPPLDCGQFRPVTSKPSEGYVLTYIGKEAKYSVLKAIADSDVKIKAFGFKTSFPTHLLTQPNIEFLGKVSDQELVDLYSNALYTLFTFTHEPFGYIPVESMACGTPVLTYNRQGPRETVINGVTGWLAKSDNDLVELAARIWSEDYSKEMRTNSRERALEFGVEVIAEKWLKIIDSL